MIRNAIICFIIFPLVFTSLACKDVNGNDSKEKYKSPPGYNLNDPEKLKLPAELDEISGISYYAKDSSLFCINDEKGILYKVYLDQKKEMQNWKFAKKGDFEDLVLVDSNFYVLQSKGELIRFKFFSGDSINISNIPIPLQGKNEFEILYLDKNTSRLMLICKDCEQDKKSEVSAIGYDPATGQTSTVFKLAAKDIEKALDEKGKFKPSAAAINPLTNELFIVSSVNKAMVICTPDGKLKEVYALDPKLFKQPEGLSFTPAGDLIISNESADKGAANILFYRYKKKNS